ncbi:cell growth-regulating nucleolar protein [Ambystoma mexicanum]|uniref:cell growth-regulating nucleolar protein n=1 Tax=Ambystoma mexicanum TaxID=8296 RepID=UPI0037E73F97
MVFFTCNACGESLKKVQVEKHLHVCRSSKCLSCIDCGKDFWGNDYKNHLKCISEDQKYGGKGFEAKANKGEVKQLQWIQKIHEVMKKPSISPKLRDILNQISTYDNIPRKRAKFQNWMKNSLKIHDQFTQEKVWEIFSEANSNGSGNVPSVVKEPTESETAPVEQHEMTVENAEKKKSKRERKEERQKCKKKQKKELMVGNQQDDSLSKKGKKHCEAIEEAVEDPQEGTKSNEVERKKKKKKHVQESNGDVEDAENDQNIAIVVHEKTKGELKKRKHRPTEDEPAFKQVKTDADLSIDEGEDQGMSQNTMKGKFNWKGTIKAVLKEAPDNELTVKKLRKKVLAQYYSVTTEHHKSEEDVFVIFNKKIHCNPKFRVLKEKVKLLK